MAKKLIRCKVCGFVFEVEEEAVKNEKYMQCCNNLCMRIFLNPFYEEHGD